MWVTLSIAIVALYLAWRDAHPLLERLVATYERRWPELAPTPAAPEAPTAALPPDIEQLALGESEEWARDSVRSRAWELYRHFDGDWDATKRVLYAERQATMFGGDPNTGIS